MLWTDLRRKLPGALHRMLQPPRRPLAGGKEGTRFKTRTLHHSGLMLGSTAPVRRICRTKLIQNTHKTAGLGPTQRRPLSGLGHRHERERRKKKKDLLQVPCSVYASTCSSPVFQNAVAATWYCLLHQIHRHSMPTFPTSFACILRSIPISSCFVYAHVPIID